VKGKPLLVWLRFNSGYNGAEITEREFLTMLGTLHFIGA
jgi:hypothetical protein